MREQALEALGEAIDADRVRRAKMCGLGLSPPCVGEAFVEGVGLEESNSQTVAPISGLCEEASVQFWGCLPPLQARG